MKKEFPERFDWAIYLFIFALAIIFFLLGDDSYKSIFSSLSTELLGVFLIFILVQKFFRYDTQQNEMEQLKKELSKLRKTVNDAFHEKQSDDPQTKSQGVGSGYMDDTKQIVDLYRKLFETLPDTIDNVTKTMGNLKENALQELQEASDRNDQQLQELIQTRLGEIELTEQILKELPMIKDDLLKAIGDFESRLQVLDMFQEGTPLHFLLKELELFVINRTQEIDTNLIDVAENYIEIEGVVLNEDQNND